MKKNLFKALFLLTLITKTTTSLSMESASQTIWTPKTVIGTAITIGFIKLGYDGLQKIFNHNKHSFSTLNTTLSGQGSKKIKINIPNAVIPNPFTIQPGRLTQAEEFQEICQGSMLFGIGALGTLAGLYYLKS